MKHQSSINRLDLALSLAKQGKENEAYKLSKGDIYLDLNVSKEQWLRFAKIAAACRQKAHTKLDD